VRLPRDYIKTPVGMHRNGGRLASGMPVGIPPESRSASERNAGRHGPDSAAGLIEDGNAWSDLQKMRNLTSHTYNEDLAENVYTFVVEQGVLLFQQLAQKARLWKTTN